MATTELQRPYWNARIYVYRVTSPTAYKWAPALVNWNEPMPTAAMPVTEPVHIERMARVTDEALKRMDPDDLRGSIVQGAANEYRAVTGHLLDARAFTVELMDDREDPMMPAFPQTH